ncbi:hypothetical protein C8Q76DRAFT_694844 [Earliella scabrosa]|nr:hypothetical protein C8Q76DRAFT_694844 [Earliella scabrosa]
MMVHRIPRVYLLPRVIEPPQDMQLLDRNYRLTGATLEKEGGLKATTLHEGHSSLTTNSAQSSHTHISAASGVHPDAHFAVTDEQVPSNFAIVQEATTRSIEVLIPKSDPLQAQECTVPHTPSPHSLSSAIPGRDVASTVIGNHDLMRQVFESFIHDPLDERRRLGRACVLVSRSFFKLGTTLIWSDLSDHSDLNPLFRLLDAVMFTPGLLEKVFSPSYKYYALQYQVELTTSVPWHNFLFYASLVQTAKSLTHLTLRIWDKERWLLPSHYCLESDSLTPDTGFSSWMNRLRHKLVVLSPYLEVFVVESIDHVFGHVAIEDYFESLHRIPVNPRTDGNGRIVDNWSLTSLREVQWGNLSGPSELFQAIASFQSHNFRALRKIELLSAATKYNAKERRFLNEVSVILDLPQLQVINIRFIHQRFFFNDDDFRTLVMAWPSIEELDVLFILETRSNKGPHVMPQLVSLGFAARRCPNLRIISLPGLFVPAVDEHPFDIGAPENHPLMHIRTREMYCLPQDVATIADALEASFSKLVPYHAAGASKLSVPVTGAVFF